MGDLQHRPGRAAYAAHPLRPLLGKLRRVQGLPCRLGDGLQFPALGPDLAHVPVKQVQRPHRQALGPQDAALFHLHDLRAAAADIEHGAGTQVQGAQGTVIAQLRLLVPGEHLHQKPRLPADGVHRLLGIADVAQRRGGKHLHPLHAAQLQQPLEPPERVAGAADARLGQGAAGNLVGKSRHLLFGKQQVESAAGQRIVYGQPDGVGTQIHHGILHSHRSFPGLPFAGSFLFIVPSFV